MTAVACAMVAPAALALLLPFAPARAQSAASAPAAAASSPVSDALVKARNAQAVAEMLKALTVEMPTTASPATFVLGVAGTEVPRVSTLREFASEITNGVDDQGRIARSVAVEFNPLLAMGPVKWSDYQDSRRTRVLTRTTLSFATRASEGEGSAAKAAFGLQSVLYSKEAAQAIEEAGRGDCAMVANAFATSRERPTAITPGELPLKLVEVSDAAKEGCRKKVQGLLTKWNPTSVAIGLGQALQSTSGKVGGLRRASTVAWVTGTYGIDRSAASDPVEERLGLGLTAHWRRTLHDRIADPADAGAELNENARLLGLNLRFGNRKLAGLIEASQRNGASPGLAEERRRRHVLGLEYRIQRDLYLVVGIGGDTGRRDGKNERIGLMNLKWGFASESSLDPR